MNRERRQALDKTRHENGGLGFLSHLGTMYPNEVARFPNGDVINGYAVNMEVINWIREQLITQMMNRIREFKIYDPKTIPALNVDRIRLGRI